MNQSQNEQPQGSFLADCARIYREWHDRAKAIDTEGLLALYAEDAVLESPLVPAILDDKIGRYPARRERIAPVFGRGWAATPK